MFFICFLPFRRGSNKKLEIVKLLLKLGADANRVRKGQGSMELSPLHNAVNASNYDE
ncbi:hypothetical protein [Wolbachia endosymbiont (group E) of Neria commutata]|uniref:hypothetical protein n=1 Tax=Wolbachia endosymbiont (group E) of Neria commutata TaxID=3066149 RepID=UPI003132C9E4